MTPAAEASLRAALVVAAASMDPVAVAALVVEALRAEGLSAELPAEKASKGCLRQRAYRERRASHVTSQRHGGEGGALSSDLEISQRSRDHRGEGECREGEGCDVTRNARRNDRGTRMPSSDEGPEVLAAFVARWKLVPGHPEWPRFLDHWRAQPGARGRKADWTATWRNWERRAKEFAPASSQVRLRAVPTEESPADVSARLRKERARIADVLEQNAKHLAAGRPDLMVDPTKQNGAGHG